MINDIKNAFIQHVQGITWMDKATRQVTLEKAAEMLSFVGYPDWLFKDGALDRKYQGVIAKNLYKYSYFSETM